MHLPSAQAHSSPSSPILPFAVAPDWLTVPAVADAALALAALGLALILLTLQHYWRGSPLRRPFVLFAAFAGCCAAGAGLAALPAAGWVGPVRLGVAALACVAAVFALRSLRRAVADERDAATELARLRLLEEAVLASNDGVMIAQTDTGPRARTAIVYANPAFEHMTGYGTDEAIGLSPSVLADSSELEALTAVRGALRATEPLRMEIPGRHKDGSRVWAEWQVVPVADESGRLTHSVAVLRDTTDRRAAEQALRESEARFRGLFEYAADAIFVIDPDGRIVDCNRRASECLGYPREELAGLMLPDLDAVPPANSVANSEPGQTPAEPLATENWFRRKDGTSFPVEVRFATLEAGGRCLKLAVVRDATRSQRAEQALREREELLRNIIAHIPCAVFWKDRDSVYLGCNDRVARDHGLTGPADVVGRTDYELGIPPAEATFYRDCDRLVVETGSPIVNLEEAQTRPDGVRATLLTSKVPLRDAAGEIIGVLGVYQDITDRKRLEEQLRQSQKMEAVGQLAGGVAHDFNNLLTVILGNAELLRYLPPGSPDAGPLTDDIHTAADRAATLTRQLLTFSRRHPSRPEVVDFNEVVAALGGLLGRLLSARITVQTRLSPVPVRVLADRGHLEQVVMNLAVNARDAMPDGGTLTIVTEWCDGFARLSVSDTGVGMTEEVKARIFEPFFTTKAPDRGTGLGLAVVHGVVEQAGGRIEVESAPGRGTTFRIDLPECSDGEITPVPIRTPYPAGAWAARGGTVLLVEDEDAVRKLARYVLEERGYTVVEALDAETALGLLPGNSGIDLLVTDLVMPGMGGRELAVRVRAANPQVGVVFMSGYAPDAGRLAEIPDSVFLPKPFTPTELARTVRDAMPQPHAVAQPA
jgi:two-component system cell cycle sensor histidine kinase/response regulator CckA